jgi:hypothetical protein
MPTTPDPIVFLPDGTNIPHPIEDVVVDDLVIPARMVLADGFVIGQDGRVTLTLKAKSHVTLRYSDDDGPAERTVEVNGL